MESDRRQTFSTKTGETVDQVTSRPFPGRYWSSHDLRSLHVLEAVTQARISDPRLCEVVYMFREPTEYAKMQFRIGTAEELPVYHFPPRHL